MRPRIILVLLAATAALTAAGSASATRERAPAPFVVTSTIDGKTVLPQRIRWWAEAPSTKLAQMEFLIDGKLAWLEENSPYTFSDQENNLGNVDRGYLATSWLTPGMHRFSVRATAKDGRVATDTVSARVVATPNPPAALAGRWQRAVDPAGAPKPGSAGAPADTPTPAGAYTLVIDKRWIQTRNPGTFTHASVDDNTGLGYIQDTDYTPGPSTFRARGVVSWRPF